MNDTRTVVGIDDVWISVDIDDSSDVTIAIGTDTQETWPIEAFFAKDAPKLRELAAAITAAADHIDPPAPSGGASPTPTAEPRTWQPGDPEPTDIGLTLLASNGVRFRRAVWGAPPNLQWRWFALRPEGDGQGHTWSVLTGTYNFAFTEVPGMSGGGQPEPRQQWAVQHPSVRTTAHNSPHSTLYTLSKLPGGTIVTRHHPDEPWTPTTECMCGGTRRDDGGHFQGCPAAVSGGGQP